MTDLQRVTLNNMLTLHTPQGAPLTIQALELVGYGGRECSAKLIFKISWQDYQRVESSEFFHLKYGSYNPPVEGTFITGQEVEIEAQLLAELMPLLSEDIEKATAYLRRPPNGSPLLLTESWQALSVSQQLGDSKLGYETSLNRGLTSQSPLYEAMVSYFKANDWPFERISENTLVRIIYHGNNGKWLCYASTDETKKQFIFYSIVPEKALPEHLAAVSEFINRVNYALAIGNFELDFSDGEMRFKTSLEVEGDFLRPALLHNLVYANIAQMDHYLTGIMQVALQGADPAQTVAEIEG